MAGTMLVLLLSLAPGAGWAQDSKLVVKCAIPQPVAQGSATPPAPGASDKPKAAPVATVSCQLRTTDAVKFKAVKAAVKGRSEPLDVEFSQFSEGGGSLAVLFLVQISDQNRRGLVAQMSDAVLKMTDARSPQRRFAAYSFANDLNLVADFTASKADFDRQVRGLRAVAWPSQLYKVSLEAIAKLAKESTDRKALVILGDGTSDDVSYEHEQVVKAAADAGIVIHALGYLSTDAADLPKFQVLRRLADDTGGFRREARVGSAQRFAVSNRFVPDVLENGGTAKIMLTPPAGPATVTVTADFEGGRSDSVDYAVTVPATPASPGIELPKWLGQSPAADEGAPQPWYRRALGWLLGTPVGLLSGAGLCLALAGLATLAVRRRAKSSAAPADDGRIYGWLDMLDGNASKYPLRTTNVRIGRHRDNDICLQNDSISRRHALLHFNAANRRFVITDLGGDNGVIVNKIKQQSHELNDGDLVELGEVQLRFRTNAELTS